MGNLDPLTCPKCQGRIKIISFIEDPEVTCPPPLSPAKRDDGGQVKKILKHLDLWNLKARPPPRADAPPKSVDQWLDYSDSQLPPSYVIYIWMSIIPKTFLPNFLKWPPARRAYGEKLSLVGEVCLNPINHPFLDQ